MGAVGCGFPRVLWRCSVTKNIFSTSQIDSLSSDKEKVAMKILIAGNLGYVGATVCKYLRHEHPHAVLHGLDNAYFAYCLTGVTRLPEQYLNAQFYGDVRSITSEQLAGYDAVVQLAAVSNDPMGAKFEKVTEEINRDSTIMMARIAASAGVKNFVFASSCSIYGIADGGPRQESDPVNPVRALLEIHG